MMMTKRIRSVINKSLRRGEAQGVCPKLALQPWPDWVVGMEGKSNWKEGVGAVVESKSL
jgi:hypothetical protein